MPSLNYKHLEYFWTVVREGGVTRASARLHLTQPAISSQVRKLERALGIQLFQKSGRSLVLTDAGRVVYDYAEQIFGLGRELVESLRGQPAGRPLRLVVGLTDALPKLVAYRLLAPALRIPDPVTLLVHEDRLERLFAELAAHTLDVVLSDAPLPPSSSVRAFNHLLGDCGVTVFGSATLADRFEPGFPASLDGAPFLVPGADAALRLGFDRWCAENGLRPRIVAEITDSALLKTFGQAGTGLFLGPSAVESEIRRQFRVRALGQLPGLRERFFAVTVERRLKHPAVVAISAAARSDLFGATSSSPPA